MRWNGIRENKTLDDIWVGEMDNFGQLNPKKTMDELKGWANIGYENFNMGKEWNEGLKR